MCRPSITSHMIWVRHSEHNVAIRWSQCEGRFYAGTFNDWLAPGCPIFKNPEYYCLTSMSTERRKATNATNQPRVPYLRILASKYTSKVSEARCPWAPNQVDFLLSNQQMDKPSSINLVPATADHVSSPQDQPGCQDHTKHSMLDGTTTSTRKDGRVQPWKAYWPPNEGTGLQPAYGFKKGEQIRIWGN
jgi:hypothetical protein